MLRKRILSGIVVGLVLVALLLAVGERAGLSALDRPPGQGFWLASRAGGLTAYVALSLAMIAGLLLSTGLGDALLSRARAVEVHRFLSTASLVLVAGHALALLGDGVVRFDALDLLVPFASRYRPVAVGLGTIAAYAAVVVHASFSLQRRLGHRTWRALHYASFALYALATVHGVTAGSDRHRPFVAALYLGGSAVVMLLGAARIVTAYQRLQAPPAGSTRRRAG
jgi:predicted ferric reductase